MKKGNIMKAYQSTNYNPKFPEHFTWSHLDSSKLASLGNIISAHILTDLQTSERLYVAGLRAALRHIAGLGEI